MQNKKIKYIKVRVSDELKKDFQKKLSSKCINMSALIHQWIKDYVKEENYGSKR